MNTGTPILPDRKIGVRHPDEEVGGQPGSGEAPAVAGGAEAEVCVLELNEVQDVRSSGRDSWLKLPHIADLPGEPRAAGRSASRQSVAGAGAAGSEVGGPSRADQQGRSGKAAVHAGHARPAAAAGAHPATGGRAGRALQRQRTRPAGQRGAGRSLRPGPAGAAAAGSHGQRHSGQYRRHRSTWSAAACWRRPTSSSRTTIT